ncbi:cell division protein FtsK, partial [Komagataeibacter sp. FXV3]|nr:cell division protein FtsK [Komagataeibacter sp. FXV3]
VVWLLGLVLGGLLVLLALALSLSEWRGIGRGIRILLRQPMVLAVWLRRITGERAQARTVVDTAPYSGGEKAARDPSPFHAPLPDTGHETGTEPVPATVRPASGTAMMPVADPQAAKPLGQKNMPAPTTKPETKRPALAGRKAEGGKPAQVSLQTSWMHPPGMDEEITQPLLMDGSAPVSDQAPWHEDTDTRDTRPVITAPHDDDLPVAAKEPARPTLLSRFFSGAGRAAEESAPNTPDYAPTAPVAPPEDTKTPT